MSECNDTCKYYKHCWSRGESLKEDGEECVYYEPERPHGEWIPCSERLPEEGKLILVTLNPISLKDSVHPVIITKYTTEKDSWIHTIPDAVLAWMPLPKPYRREGEAE